MLMLQCYICMNEISKKLQWRPYARFMKRDVWLQHYRLPLQNSLFIFSCILYTSPVFALLFCIFFITLLLTNYFYYHCCHCYLNFLLHHTSHSMSTNLADSSPSLYSSTFTSILFTCQRNTHAEWIAVHGTLRNWRSQSWRSTMRIVSDRIFSRAADFFR